MPIAAEDVVKRFLAGLLKQGGYKKATLAPAMNTSRGHLDVMLREGNLLMEHVTSLSESMKAGPHVVFRALAVIAEMMYDEDQASRPPQAVADDELPGRADRRRISAEKIESSQDEPESDGHDETSSPPQPTLGSRTRSSSKPR